MTPLMFFTSNWYDIFPWASTLNLAVPEAIVFTGGERFFPDRIAPKFVCCAKAGVDTSDAVKAQNNIIEMYLLVWTNSNCSIFIYINTPKSIRLFLTIVKSVLISSE